MKDLDRLRRDFQDAIEKLPNYKRVTAWEYVNALTGCIHDRDVEINRLSDMICEIPNEVLERYVS